MNSHKFETQIAIDYDVETALLLETMSFWLQINYNNKSKKHYHDGRWWLYNSYNSWTDLLPYYSAKQMRRIIENAKKNGLILTGNYNKRKSDLTPWYSLTEKALCYFPILKEQLLSTPAQTGKTPAQTGKTPAQTGRALPDTYPDTYPDNNRDINARAENQIEEHSKTPEEPVQSPTPQTNENKTDMPVDLNFQYEEAYYLTDTRHNAGNQLATTQTQSLTTNEQNSFERFWQLYPRKAGKQKAKAQWFHDGCYRIADKIIAKLQEQIEKDKAFLDGCVPNPHKYITEQRYNDEIFQAKNKGHFDHSDTTWMDKRDIFDD